ncbi:YtxH domain-containing protein [Enorma massiliensis]|uniref:YtxH domain-containing protein n=1 Tax=Enorma massiliensis TaxID=1472761 RepID=UPI0023EFEA91|nr:YtxH domain-containing protein [Enorma massiliensis]
MGKAFSFIVGATIGAAAGTIIGILVAPRSGAETRAMAADMANDAWDSARDMYEQGSEQARAAVSDFGPMVDAKTDELRAKVDLARERMDQLRETLNDAIAGTTSMPTVEVEVEVAPGVDADEASAEA